MYKKDFVASVAEKTGLSKNAANKAVDAVLETITEALSKGDKVSFVGFGTFEVSERAARTGRNLQTGESITIPATKVGKFKAGASLKKAIKG